ncbi:hypothetical protein CH300_20125 [Rhodococcus sp. 15-1154-1]|nr:hypothetical protein [Rhodococcus sp. 15-1154-1]OZF00848.1 hypothetical protein CH300_20125 [Rhodococcus sp. 15-1154-1]
MRRTILSDEMFAALALPGAGPISWSQQPMQQQMDRTSDPDDDNDDADDDKDDSDDPDDDNDDPDDDKNDPDDPDDDNDDPDDKKLGPKGERALAAIKIKLKNEKIKRRAAEAKNRQTDDADKTKAAEREYMVKANQRILRSEVRALAAGKLADPADAIKFLDLDQFDVGNDGEVDQDDIADAIDDLVEKKPYLAAKRGDPKKRTPRSDRRQGGGGRDSSASVSAGRSLYASKHKKDTTSK